ncbi:substrate-binding domain-containing protein [Herbiconiux ginsengi]|uniref:Phosphate ABC transporter, phosphate-binding protein n=1 Tax=Herbiconiux ginsengi TaxID=381665 RepID=A0A1H3T4C2_9MICO|nr:substrate-binding domain-containing protein [Herbiconiux ginsengi]SDZ45183.1 phosphate ABC transporter, phosphate-binding protein [Herbiconiux ginsengi]
MTRRRLSATIAALLGLSLVLTGSLSAAAASYPRISGNGSSWAGAAIDQWRADVAAQGVTIDFTNDGSSAGRKNFAQEISDFAVSEIPYDGDTADPQDTARPSSPYAMLPIVAGGTSFMYNLPVDGSRFEDLKLSQDALAGIFTGGITRWNDPAIAVENPGVNLPDNQITVVVRSDGSGATAQFTLWMKRAFPDKYAALCARAGCDPAHATSYFPYQGLSNFTAQSQSNGVTTYTSGTEYTINYDEYAYPLGLGFPVAKVKNAAGFYTVPTAPAVAVALTQAIINTDASSPNYLSQDLSNVYGYGDPRSYPMSAYSYLLVPAAERGLFDAAKGATLAYYANYSLCEGQQKMGDLGYSPLPMNLVLAALDQVRKIPGVDADTAASMDATTNGALHGGGNPCNNPTFRPGDSPSQNVLVETAPFPDGCDAACQAPWTGIPSGSGPTYETTTDPNAPAAGGAPDAAANGPAAGAANNAAGSCDPNTGICANAGAAAGSGGTVKTVPTVLASSTGWAGPQSLMIIIGLLILTLIVGPPLVNRLLNGRGRRAPGERS